MVSKEISFVIALVAFLLFWYGIATLVVKSC